MKIQIFRQALLVDRSRVTQILFLFVTFEFENPKKATEKKPTLYCVGPQASVWSVCGSKFFWVLSKGGCSKLDWRGKIGLDMHIFTHLEPTRKGKYGYMEEKRSKKNNFFTFYAFNVEFWSRGNPFQTWCCWSWIKMRYRKKWYYENFWRVFPTSPLKDHH